MLFVASAALGAGVFLYKQFLAIESASKLSQLERAKAAFQPSLIQELTRLDDRMHAADRILGAHIAPTAFFLALQQATLETVAFQTLDFQSLDPQDMKISMTGVAQSVNSIALQADLFSKNGVIMSPIFSNIARQPDGVHFNLSAVVNPKSIGYSELIAPSLDSGAQSQALPPSSTEAPADPSPFNTSGDAPETDSPQN